MRNAVLHWRQAGDNMCEAKVQIGPASRLGVKCPNPDLAEITSNVSLIHCHCDLSLKISDT